MRAEAWLLRRRTAQDDARFVEICVARSTRRLSEAKWLYRQPLGFSRGLCFAMDDCDVKGGCVSRGGANSFEAESEQGQKRESDHIHGEQNVETSECVGLMSRRDTAPCFVSSGGSCLGPVEHETRDSAARLSP